MTTKLTWGVWLYGLISALIGGGSGAVSAAIGVNLIDAKDWNVTDHTGHLFALMGVCFVVNGAIASFAYLAKSPLPQVETVTTEKTVELTSPAGDVSTAKVIAKTTTSTVPEVK